MRSGEEKRGTDAEALAKAIFKCWVRTPDRLTPVAASRRSRHRRCSPSSCAFPPGFPAGISCRLHQNSVANRLTKPEERRVRYRAWWREPCRPIVHVCSPIQFGISSSGTINPSQDSIVDVTHLLLFGRMYRTKISVQRPMTRSDT